MDNNNSRATNKKFNPIEATSEITEAYRRYTISTFTTDIDAFNEQIRDKTQKEYTLVKGPYLQISDNYKKSKSIGELTDAFLSKKFLELDADKLSPEFVLYEHQTKAVENIIVNDRSTVVTTGTGSGKTESFLIPILNHLMREEEQGTLSRKGVRVLIIYPMNALVNDQIKRMRGILKNYKKITFGAFTGDTEKEYKDAHKEYKSRFGYEPLENERISRDIMSDSPPHILITNYAMLERILIKPENSVGIFSSGSNSQWKYIVLDEAHTYGGAKGTEVSMLLRRIKATLKNDKLRFILTSATLGDKGSTDEVAEFAKNLTGAEEFNETDVIRAEYERMEAPSGIVDKGGEYYTDLAKIVGDPEQVRKMFPGNHDQYISLGESILSESMIWKIRGALKNGVKKISDISAETGYSESQIVDFINVATAAKDKNGLKLFDAKYHVFIRAIEGVYVTLAPSWKLSFTPVNAITDGGIEYAAFQMSSCYNCGAIYIPGSEDVKGRLKQIPEAAIERNQEDIRDTVFLLCTEDDVDDEYPDEFYCLCSKCGVLSPFYGSLRCQCGLEYRNVVRKMIDDGSEDKLCTCPKCEQVNTQIGIVRDFYLGADAASSVIASSLYYQLPMNDVEGVDVGGQFIMFSDSRSGASYAAVSLEKSYKNILMHRAIVEVTKRKPELFKEGIRFDDFVKYLTDILVEVNVPEVERDQLRTDSAVYLTTEAACNNSSKAIEFKGLFRFETTKKIKAFEGLTQEETESLCNTLIKHVRDVGAVAQPEVLAGDDFLNAIKYPAGIVKKSDEKKKNERVFLTKKMKAYLGKLVGLDKVDYFTSIFFDNFLVLVGKAHRLNLSDLKIVPSPVHYHCNKCQKYFPFNVRNICPHCNSGILEEEKGDFDVSDEHYTHLYRESPLIPLSVEEHTAQLSKANSTRYQANFTKKKINALSCSTTFEMGIDLGDLETVFMRNVPPSPSNYTQRAGRAGRGKDTSAFVLTFCKSASHDSHYFDRPENMIDGRIVAPTINVNNPKIVIRHIMAAALSFYWKTKGATPKNVEEMLSEVYTFQYYSYLASNPMELKAFLKEFVPLEIQDFRSDEVIISLDDFGWVNCLNGENEEGKKIGRFELAKDVFNSDIAKLEEAREAAENKGVFNRTIVTLKEEESIKFLSKNNILPKYGFPVDTVELENSSPGVIKDFELQRDLAMAITEYAPGSQVIANKKLVTSGYVKVVKGREWDRYTFSKCGRCQALTAERTTGDSQIITCEVCGQENESSNIFIIPKFGFQYNTQREADIYKPRRAHGTKYLYRGDKSGETKQFCFGQTNGTIQHNVDDELVTISNDAYRICENCGFGLPISKKPGKHKSPYGKECSGKMAKFNLGHIFKTDVTIIHFDGPPAPLEERISVLYALIRGLCAAFDIEMKEISGCLRPNEDGSSDYVLFDNTPGGAGYVKKITPESIQKVVLTSLKLLRECDCGEASGDCSCYSCLKDYRNQMYHNILNRRIAIAYLSKITGGP